MKSVKRAKDFFSAKGCDVARVPRSLDEMELVARGFGDWRLHMALARASFSGPPLRSEAYAAGQLDAQLADQTARFLKDPVRGLRVDGKRLRLSQLFKWKRADLPTSGGASAALRADTLLPILLPYLDPAVGDGIVTLQPSITYLDYDWNLNGRT